MTGGNNNNNGSSPGSSSSGNAGANGNDPWSLAFSLVNSYGCVCSSNPNQRARGAPIDATDRACHNHKMCLRCVKDEFGSECGSAYTYRNGVCADSKGTCERQRCECDKAFAAALANAQIDSQYANGGAEAMGLCRFPGLGGTGACCKGRNDLNVWYNSYSHCCSSSGRVEEFGTCS